MSSDGLPGWSVTVPALSDVLPGQTGRHSRSAITFPTWSDTVPECSVSVPVEIYRDPRSGILLPA